MLPEGQEGQDVGAETSDVDASGSGAKAEGADSSAEQLGDQGSSGQDENTVSEGEAPGEDLDDKVEEGQPIPYERFKKVNDTRRSIETENKALKAELEEAARLLQNPEVFKSVLKAQGITDPNILRQKMAEAGHVEDAPVADKKEIFKKMTEGVNLSTQEGWLEVMERMFDHYSKKAIAPIEQKLGRKEAEAWLAEREGEARNMAKDVYGVEYGQSGKDENNPNTAVGKMVAYLRKNPDDARLGHAKILKLAMAEEGFRAAEKKGVRKEKERQDGHKRSAMEDDARASRGSAPGKDWSVEELLAWREKYAK
jgi:hypothetical protein